MRATRVEAVRRPWPLVRRQAWPRSVIMAFGLALLLPALAWATPVPTTPQPALVPLNINSSYGSGAFGRWIVDQWGLPAYRYDINEQMNPIADNRLKPNVGTQATHVVGAGQVLGVAFNHGYTQLFSKLRRDEWMNRYDTSNGSQHYAGGFGYLNLNGVTTSTLYLDQPAGAKTQRVFGTGYYEHRLQTPLVNVTEYVYAPFGQSDPVLLHDVVIRNTSKKRERGSWIEYWDVNPYDQTLGQQRGLHTPVWNQGTHTLSVGEQVSPVNGAVPADNQPLSIFAAPIRGGVARYETSASAFFGSGTRAAPHEVKAGHLGDHIAPPNAQGSVGKTMFAFQAPVNLAPGQQVVLRYIYGTAHAKQIPSLVAKYRRAKNPLAASEKAWVGYVPKANWGPKYTWLSRELAWDAYRFRAGAAYEELCGHHTIGEESYYLFVNGMDLNTEEWLQYVLPLTWSDPGLAREILRYTVHEQQAQRAYQMPESIESMCSASGESGTVTINSNENEAWLMISATEYGLATRDFKFFRERIPYRDTGTATIWEHIKRAFYRNQSQIQANGNYGWPTPGVSVSDWADQFILAYPGQQVKDSIYTTALTAYAYPRLAELADLLGDHAFAATVRAAAARAAHTLASDWVSRGWYYRVDTTLGKQGVGVIYLEPQPWAILAGVPTRSQATTLVSNIRRYLTGIGAPTNPGGAGATVGSEQVAAKDDPGITERSPSTADPAAAAWLGGQWFFPNGWLVWSLAALDGVVPKATTYAWDEYLRNTLTRRAVAFPSHWDGITSLDEVCGGWYDTPAQQPQCGLFYPRPPAWEGNDEDQPAWMIFDSLTLAGIRPTSQGYRITPHLPMRTFGLSFPTVGVRYSANAVQGYVSPQGSAVVQMEVAPPKQLPSPVAVYVNGKRVRYTMSAGLIRFPLRSERGRAVSWVIKKR